MVYNWSTTVCGGGPHLRVHPRAHNLNSMHELPVRCTLILMEALSVCLIASSICWYLSSKQNKTLQFSKFYVNHFSCDVMNLLSCCSSHDLILICICTGALTVAKLIGCDIGDLKLALSTRKMRVGNDNIVQKLTLSQVGQFFIFKHNRVIQYIMPHKIWYLISFSSFFCSRQLTQEMH